MHEGTQQTATAGSGWRYTPPMLLTVIPTKFIRTMAGIFEQDFMMRQIEQLVRALRSIISKKNQGLDQEAQILIDQTLSELLKEDAKDVQSLTLSETLEALKNEGQFNAELAYVVGEILYEKAEFEREVGTSKKLYTQAYLLFYKAKQDPSVAFPVTTMEKISRMEETLEASSLEDVKHFVDKLRA